MSGARRAIITGAGGFLGGAATRLLLAEGWSVATIGHGAVPEGVRLATIGDVTAEAVAALAGRLGGAELVLHAAGTGSVGAAAARPEREHVRTVATTAAVIEAIRRSAPTAVLVYPSSAAVYGDTGPAGVDETASYRPISSYGEHKVLAERVCLAAHREFGLRCAILRFGSLFGVGLRKQLFWDMAHRLAAGEKELVLAGTGEESRDFLSGEDAARVVSIAASAAREKPLILNAGTGTPLSIRHAAELFVRFWAPDRKVRFSGETRPSDPAHLRLLTDRIAALGFAPIRPFRDSIADYAVWARAALGDAESYRGSAGAL